MKRKTKLTRRQKIFFAECGLKPENWYVEKETDTYIYAVSKNGQHRLLEKNNQKG